jgi:hypothetical protein
MTPSSRLRVCRHALALLPFFFALNAPAAHTQSSLETLVARLDSLAGAPVQEGRAVGISVAVIRGTRLIGHGGAISGFTSDASWYPDETLAVVVLMNSTGPVSPSALASELAGEIIPPIRRTARPFTGDAPPLAGTYT